ncbi:twin-arginine translocase subunit TatC [bacterium]|nr:twin-arginine translocase subunit TatC [bacterium]MCB2179067.1 twin-arginine translocase subunit TatC [bacterium]
MIKKAYLEIKNFFAEEPEETPIADVLQTGFENPTSILYHLNELRKHVFRAAIGFVITTALSFVFITQILDWLTAPIGGIAEMQAIEVTEPVSVVMRVALLTGFSLALPYIAFELMLFAAPGLSRRARLVGIFSIPLVFIFFVGGMAFAYYFMLDAALPVLLNFMGIPTLPRPSSYVRFVTGLMFWIGVSFEFPLIAYVLSAMRLLKPEVLRDNWRIAVIGIAVLAAMITPTVDPINMGIVMVPLILLYVMGIGMSHLAWGGRRRQEAEAT